MPALLIRLALLLPLILACTLRADPAADVKAVMDAPVTLAYIADHRAPNFNPRHDRAELAAIFGKSVQEVERARGVSTTRRIFMGLLGQTQGMTAEKLSALNRLASTNSSLLRDLSPALKAAGLSTANRDLETALQSLESGKTLDRSTQDLFARLARVAP